MIDPVEFDKVIKCVRLMDKGETTNGAGSDLKLSISGKDMYPMTDEGHVLAERAYARKKSENL